MGRKKRRPHKAYWRGRVSTMADTEQTPKKRGEAERETGRSTGNRETPAETSGRLPEKPGDTQKTLKKFGIEAKPTLKTPEQYERLVLQKMKKQKSGREEMEKRVRNQYRIAFPESAHMQYLKEHNPREYGRRREKIQQEWAKKSREMAAARREYWPRPGPRENRRENRPQTRGNRRK